MNRLLVSFLLISAIPFAAVAQENAVGTSTVTIGIGGNWQFQNSLGLSGGPVFNGTYEYRLRQHWSAEFGVDTSLVTAPTFSLGYLPAGPCSGIIATAIASCTYVISNYSTGIKHNTSMPFGLRGILPLSNGRVELVAGLGAAYVWNPVVYSYNSSLWAVQSNLGVRVAVDKQRHFWLGSTGRYFRSFHDSPREWYTWTADVGFRFGR